MPQSNEFGKVVNKPTYVETLPVQLDKGYNWRRLHALGLPAGSVRALLAILVVGGIWAWLYKSPDKEVPSYLRDVMFIILGHYFASRSKPALPSDGPPPLFLPRGTIRFLLLLGFMTVAGVLFWEHRMVMTYAGLTLILVCGFLLGVIFRSRIEKVSRKVEDIRAIVSLTAGVLLILMVFGLSYSHNEHLQALILKYRVQDILAALVGFYFGSRS